MKKIFIFLPLLLVLLSFEKVNATCINSFFYEVNSTDYTFSTSYIEWNDADGYLDCSFCATGSQILDADITIPYTVAFKYSSQTIYQTYEIVLPKGSTSISYDLLLYDFELLNTFWNDNPAYRNSYPNSISVTAGAYEYSGSLDIVGLDY